MSSQKRVLILRHGIRQDFIDPQWKETAPEPDDSPLSQSGHDQAQEVAKYILSQNHNLKAILCSPYLRTLETATPVAKALSIPIFVEYGLSEAYSEAWVGMTFKTAERVPWDFFPIDKTYSPITVPKNDEDIVGLHHRVLPVIKAVQQDPRFDGDVLIVTHALTKIALVRGFAKDISLHVEPATCSLTEIRFQGERHIIEKLCGTDHLSSGIQYPWFVPQTYQDLLVRAIDYSTISK